MSHSLRRTDPRSNSLDPEAIFGPGDSSDSGSDCLDVLGTDLPDTSSAVDVALREGVVRRHKRASMRIDGDGSGADEDRLLGASDVGVDRVVIPSGKTGDAMDDLDDEDLSIDDEDEDPDLAFIDEQGADLMGDEDDGIPGGEPALPGPSDPARLPADSGGERAPSGSNDGPVSCAGPRKPA
jgi:hypothetical protein